MSKKDKKRDKGEDMKNIILSLVFAITLAFGCASMDNFTNIPVKSVLTTPDGTEIPLPRGVVSPDKYTEQDIQIMPVSPYVVIVRIADVGTEQCIIFGLVLDAVSGKPIGIITFYDTDTEKGTDQCIASYKAFIMGSDGEWHKATEEAMEYFIQNYRGGIGV